jgi:hypothetical protein
VQLQRPRVSSGLIPRAFGENDPNDRQHYRDFDEDADHGCQRRWIEIACRIREMSAMAYRKRERSSTGSIGQNR